MSIRPIYPSDPADLTAVEARALISRGKLSPVELAQACIQRVEAVNHAVNAVVAYDFDALMDEAKIAESKLHSKEPLGLLHGLPIGIKDMIDVAGLPTTFGSIVFKNNQAYRDDVMVAALRTHGGSVLGKTNVPEFSAGGNTRNAVYGATANPYDPKKSCAGSSGGSAVALATGMAPLCTGSDTAGSLRNPAAFCGVVGFRPSPGVVPGTKRGLALIPLPTMGPMGRTVADAALLLAIMARPDRKDPYTTVIGGRTPWDQAEFTMLPRVDLSSLRVAMTEDYGFALTENTIRQAFQRRCEVLASYFGTVIHATPDCTNADEIFSILRAMMILGGYAGHMRDHADELGPNIRTNWVEATSYSTMDMANSLTLQGDYFRNWQIFFETHDYLISPAVTISPRDWRELYPMRIDGQPTKSYYHWLSMAYASTIAGHPAITIPMGRDNQDMPFGLQIVGRRHDDIGVLAVAAEIEAIFRGDPEYGRPEVDLNRIKNNPPLCESEGFWGFD